MGGKLAHHLEMVEMCNPIVRWEENNCKKKKSDNLLQAYISLFAVYF